MLSPIQIITLMLSSGLMMAQSCTFGVIIWIDVNIDFIIWLGDTFSFTFCVIIQLYDNLATISSGWMIRVTLYFQNIWCYHLLNVNINVIIRLGENFSFIFYIIIQIGRQADLYSQTRLSCPSCPVLAVLSRLSCPSSPVMFREACHLFPVTVSCHYCRPCCPLQLSYLGCPLLDALS